MWLKIKTQYLIFKYFRSKKDRYFIIRRNKKDQHYEESYDSGKWLIFINKKHMKPVLKKILRLFFEQKVGCLVEVGNFYNEEYKRGLIEIYTPDRDNVSEIMSVRSKLRDIGFINGMPYKDNEKSLDHEYSGGERISTYYC